MTSENPENILLYPNWPLLRDGLGSTVMITKSVPQLDSDGREIVILTVKVDNFVKRKYSLKPKVEYDEQDNIKLIVLKNDLIPLNPYDTTNQIWLYTKSFRHEPTLLSQREANLQTLINVKDKRISLLEAENIRLNEQILLFRTNPAMAAAQGAEVFEKTAKAVADLIQRRPGDKE